MSDIIPKPSGASSESASFPWDVIAGEILPRLPPKSLAKFKRVSKFWNSHISTPHFSGTLNPVFQCHSKIERKYVFYILRGNKLKMAKLEQPPEIGMNVRSAGSCDGIICFVTVPAPFMVLWNPSTEQHSEEIRFHRSISDPQNFCAGIGRGAATDDYKVVYFEYGSSSLSSAEVYSLRDRMWNVSSISTGQLLPYHVSIVEVTWWPQSSADGRRIHWLAKCEDRRNPAAIERRRMIVSFDMCDEAFGLMDLPDCLANVDHGLDFHVEFASLPGNDLVTLFAYEKEWSWRTEYSVWVMEEYGVADSWTEIKISLGEPGRPLGYLNKHKLLFHLKRGKVLLYDTMTGERKCIRTPHDNPNIMHYVGNYMESQVQFPQGEL